MSSLQYLNQGLVSSSVYQILLNQSPPAAESFRSIYVEPQGQPTIEAQLAEMNRFWRMQLSRVPVDTCEARECLLDKCDLDDWLRLFVRYVAPVIVAHQLPHPKRTDETSLAFESLSFLSTTTR